MVPCRLCASSLSTVSLPGSLYCNALAMEGLQEQAQGSGEAFQLGEGLPGEGGGEYCEDQG